jgi:hypothetical protein
MLKEVWPMSMSSRFWAVGLVLVACSSGESGDSGNTASGGSANGTGSGGSAGTGTDAGGGPTFCVLGMQGCPCDGTLCASGLVCKDSTCCNQASGDCSPPSLTTGTGGAGGGSGAGATGAGGAADSGMCVPGVVGPVITDCGYPYASSNPLTSVDFNESEVLRAIDPSGGAPLASVRLFYNDEHALTLGVRHVDVITSAGTSAKDYPVSPLQTNPGYTRYPQTGTNEVSGNYSGLDQSGRPMWPALFVTDITDDPDSRSGDWQQGGTPYNPNAVFGTWKAAVRTVDTTVTPNDVSVTPDADPAKNDWDLGGGDPVPPSLTVNQGYGAEVRWDLVLIPGRSYRIQVIVHDGDQNKVGGDSGEACVNFCAGASCPEGSAACGANDVCSGSDVCVNGCCLQMLH